VVGAGQIGTSIGMALRQSPAEARDEVLLWDRDPGQLARSLERKAANRALRAPEEVLAADTLILAIPVGEVVGWLAAWGGRVRPGTLLLDTGSAKQVVVAAMRSHLRNGVLGVGGHPLCGNEGRGPAAGDPAMLRGAPFVLTPAVDDQLALSRATALVAALGAHPLVLEAGRHDEILAVSSHLPHLLAAALLELVPQAGPDRDLWRQLLGPGFRSATRLAASDPEMVASFLAANAGPVRQAVAELQRSLGELDAELGFPTALAARLASVAHSRADLVGSC
jgi:prephenate dehydrogenase